MQAGLVSAPLNWSDIFAAPAPLYVILVAVARIPVTVRVMKSNRIPRQSRGLYL